MFVLILLLQNNNYFLMIFTVKLQYALQKDYESVNMVCKTEKNVFFSLAFYWCFFHYYMSFILFIFN